jgi:ribosomal protein L11 methyltransferase
VIEIACESRSGAQKLVKEFGGRARKLPQDWLRQFSRAQSSKPLRIGRRLMVLRSRSKREGVSFPYSLVIPAGAAFGTGDHSTTAMSLRLLEEITRKARPNSVVDLGTGSGILALAASCFGARHVIGIDTDPLAISTAKANARLNKIDNVVFRLGDLRLWKPPPRVDIIIANLFCDLLIELLPKLHGRWLILSGVLRTQEKQFTHALRRHKIDIAKTRRRGKWIALLAQ